MEVNLKDVPFLVYNGFSSKGLNTVDDPEFVDDNELTEALNIVYDNSLISPRLGSKKFTDALGATSSVQLIKATASDGEEFLLRFWGTNLELYDPQNNNFIKLNKTFNFSSGYRFAYAVWINGYGADKLYGGNMKDPTIYWHLSLDYVSVDLIGTEASIPLNDSSRFPSSGKIVIKNKTSGTEYVRDYTSKSGNSLVLLSGQTAPAVPAGSSVSIVALQNASIPNGDIYIVNQRRLFVSNSFGNETKISYSQINNPENFGGTGITAGGTEYVPDGEGGVKCLIDLVDYLLAIKTNIYQRFEFVINQTLDSKIVSIRPVISGEGIGLINNASAVKVWNSIYGFSSDGNVVRVDGITTGSNTSLKITSISKKIKNLIDSYDYSQAVGIYFNNKILFSLPKKGSSLRTDILVYDILKESWSVFNNWNADSFVVYKGKLLFSSNSDFRIYEAFSGYIDETSGYISRFKTKRFNFGEFAFPKRCDRVLITGYISRGTKINVDILYNENGKLGKISRVIEPDSASVINGSGWGTIEWGIAPFGWTNLTDIEIGFFRVYFDIPISYGYFNIQLSIYSENTAGFWSIQNIGFNPVKVDAIPVNFIK